MKDDLETVTGDYTGPQFLVISLNRPDGNDRYRPYGLSPVPGARLSSTIQIHRQKDGACVSGESSQLFDRLFFAKGESNRWPRNRNEDLGETVVLFIDFQDSYRRALSISTCRK